MSRDKAVVHTGRDGVAVVNFQNFSSGSRQEVSLGDEIVRGILVVYNPSEKVLKKDGEHDSDRQKFVEGIGGEVSHSYTNGWKNVYVSTFVKHDDFTVEDFPSEFTTSDEDVLFPSTKISELREYVEKYSSTLRKIRVVGIVSEDDFQNLKSEVVSLSTEITIEDDSPYLVVV